MALLRSVLCSGKMYPQVCGMLWALNNFLKLAHGVGMGKEHCRLSLQWGNCHWEHSKVTLATNPDTTQDGMSCGKLCPPEPLTVVLGSHTGSWS